MEPPIKWPELYAAGVSAGDAHQLIWDGQHDLLRGRYFQLRHEGMAHEDAWREIQRVHKKVREAVGYTYPERGVIPTV